MKFLNYRKTLIKYKWNKLSVIKLYYYYPPLSFNNFSPHKVPTPKSSTELFPTAAEVQLRPTKIHCAYFRGGGALAESPIRKHTPLAKIRRVTTLRLVERRFFPCLLGLLLVKEHLWWRFRQLWSDCWCRLDVLEISRTPI